AVVFGLARELNRGQDFWDVVARFLRQQLLIVQLPEIRISVSHDCSHHSRLSRVIGGHRQSPIAANCVEIAKVGCNDAGLLKRIAALVVALLDLETVFGGCGWDKLPDSSGSRRRLGARVPDALNAG